jgi:hypothetical protein
MTFAKLLYEEMALGRRERKNKKYINLNEEKLCGGTTD